MRLTRKIQQWEIDTYNPTRQEDDKYINSDYMCSRSAYDRSILNKLGQLEDIEEKYCIDSNEDLKRRLDLADKYGELGEQLGISLDILFKALKKGFYDNKGEYHHFSNLIIDIESIYDGYTKEEFTFIDYDKTWALTKEELL